ncbi:MAG: GTPase HflX, partial [Bacteroidetes bacterium]|nr:GTPase HflX [Bacteroidota bacterium]
RFTEKDADDLSPATKENLTLEELEKTWMAHENLPSLFISATSKQNIDQLRETLYQEVRKIIKTRYPENMLI